MKKNATAKAVQGTENANEATTLTVVHNATEETNNVETSEFPNQPNEEQRGGQPKTVKEIFEKSQKLTKFIQQLQNLDEAAKELDSFNLGTSKLKDTLSIRDGKGNEFETSNAFLIESAVTFLKAQIETKTVEIEAELKLAEAA